MANSYRKCLRQLVKLRPGIGLRLGDLKVETEALVFAAQEKALGTNYVQFNIDKSGCVAKRVETINHYISNCSYLAQKEYKRRHGNIARLIHWMLCCKDDLSRSEKWHDHHQLHGVGYDHTVWPCY